MAERYTHVLAPNGEVVPIIAQGDITDDQFLHVRKILKNT